MDFMNILGKVKEMQAKLKETQEGLTKITAEAESGGGMVKAIANGRRQLVKLEIDPEIIKADDKEFMQDLIVAAINKAMDEAEQKGQAEIKKATSEFMPNIPGLDLSKIM
jgi:DNA-binding YbaB/EbfC family protein